MRRERWRNSGTMAAGAIIRWMTVLLCLATGRTLGVSDVRITRLRMPSVVLNASLPSVVLDCDYELEALEKSSTGLVVKWFHNRSPAPVYQWIPGHPPQAFGILRGHVNLGHVVSDDPLKIHRAVQIRHPTTQMSGEYTCRVTTWRGVDSASKTMVIFAPAQMMNLSLDKLSREQVNISCVVVGVFPEPAVQLFISTAYTDRQQMRGLRIEKSWKDGAYTVRVQKQELNRQLPSEAAIECVLTLPGTDYRRSRRVAYCHGTAPAPLASVRENQQRTDLETLGLHGGSALPGILRSLQVLCWVFSITVSLMRSA